MQELHWRASKQFPDTRVALHHWPRSPKSTACGTLWVVHGLGEHAARYTELATYFNQLGVDVWAPDLPGHGLSKQEGGQEHFVTVAEMVQELSDIFLSETHALQTPRFLLGHSMGGVVALTWLLEQRRLMGNAEFFQSALVSAAPLELKLKVPTWKVALARGLIKVWPNLRLGNELNPEFLSYDAANVAAYRQDPLVLSYATPKVFLSVLQAGADVSARGADFVIPLCVAAGADDPIVDTAALRRFAQSLRAPKSYLEFPHAKHEIFHEIDRQRCFEAAASWFFLDKNKR